MTHFVQMNSCSENFCKIVLRDLFLEISIASHFNSFLANVLILYPLKTFGFLVFSGSKKREHWPEMLS